MGQLVTLTGLSNFAFAARLLAPRTPPSTNFCMLEIFPGTNGWWKGTGERSWVWKITSGWMGGCLQQRPPGWAWWGEEAFVSLVTSGLVISGRYYADIRQTIPASDQEMNSILAELSRVRPSCFLG